MGLGVFVFGEEEDIDLRSLFCVFFVDRCIYIHR